MAAEGKKLRYTGGFASVTVPALRVSVKRNHQVVVEDADTAAALLLQGDWEEVGAPKSKDETPPAPTEG